MNSVITSNFQRRKEIWKVNNRKVKGGQMYIGGWTIHVESRPLYDDIRFGFFMFSRFECVLHVGVKVGKATATGAVAFLSLLLSLYAPEQFWSVRDSGKSSSGFFFASHNSQASQ